MQCPQNGKLVNETCTTVCTTVCHHEFYWNNFPTYIIFLFQFHYKTPQEFPSHRMLLSLNEFLPREDKIPLKQEWGHCIDKMGILRPDFVLRWFNKGTWITYIRKDLCTVHSCDTPFVFPTFDILLHLRIRLNFRVSYMFESVKTGQHSRSFLERIEHVKQVMPGL